MKTTTIFVICILNLNPTASENHNILCKTADVPDYFWREYRGFIPYDAVPGGTDTAGLTTYIGQSLIIPHGEFVGSIYPGNKTVAGTAELKILYTDKNVKILCSGSPEKFKWMSTDTSKIYLITNCDLILGGFDRGHPLNIGRINYKEEIILGKVLTTATNSNGLWVPDSGTEKQFAQYEVLGYDCKPKIDVRRITVE